MLGAKPSSRAAAATRSLVSARSLPWPLSALEAVPIETPAMAATSRMVTRRGLVSCGDKPLLHRSLAVRTAGAPKRWAMTGLDAVSRASYLTKENLFLSQFGPTSEPPGHPARGARQAPPARDRILPGDYGFAAAFTTPAQHAEFADAPLPGVTGASYSTFDGGDDFVIPAGAPNPSGAWEFIKWALEPQQQDKYPAEGMTP